MNIEERIAAMRAGHAAQPQAAPVERKVRVEQAHPEVVKEAAAPTEKVFDAAKNTPAQIMERSDLSDKGKLEAMVDFLSADNADYHAAQLNFAEFEAYFTHEQSKRTQVSEQNIQRLMDELQDGTKTTIENILHDFNTVNTGAGNIKQLLRVMEKARVDGTTVEVLTAAYKLNEKLLKEIATLRGLLATQQKDAATASQTEHRLQDLKAGSERGVLNKIFNVFSGNARIEDSLYYSSYSLERIQVTIEKFRKTISEKEMQRDRKLEDGELTILRTVDATDGGFTAQILQTATDSLALIKGTRLSIEMLLAANAKSRAASTEITKVLNSTVGRETILKGALQLVAKETHRQGDLLGVEVRKLNAEKVAAAGNEAQVTLITVDLDRLGQTDRSALEYGRVLETRVVSFEMLASATVQAEARAQQFATLVESHHELLSSLQQQALPVTASALEMGLQQGVALRDGLLAAGVRDATKKAQEIFGANLAGASEAKTRLETENLDQMRAAILALGKAQAMITDRTDKAIERGLTSIELVGKVTASADLVRAAMLDFQKVDAALAVRDAAPPADGAGVTSADDVPAEPEQLEAAGKS